MTKRFNGLMKKGVMYLFTALLFLSMTSFHDYWVGITQINFNEKEKNIEISLKFFIDDTEKAVRQFCVNQEFTIEPKGNNEGLDNLLKNYLDKNFFIEINNKTKEPNLLGFEFEDDAIWIYLEIGGIKNVKSLQLKNTALMDVYPGQTHIVNFYANNEVNGALLKIDEPICTFSF